VGAYRKLVAGDCTRHLPITAWLEEYSPKRGAFELTDVGEQGQKKLHGYFIVL
jgi:hypothetical protein